VLLLFEDWLRTFRWAVGFYICGFDCCKHLGYINLGLSILLECFFCLFVFWNENLIHPKKKKTVKEMVLSLKQAELSA